MSFRIPFNKPLILGNEIDFVRQCLDTGKLCGDNYFSRQCQRLMEETFGAAKVLLTTSGTAALEMCALLCELQAGDEVILPSYTFVSTANAFLLRGAKLVFVDIRPDTLNIDESLIEAAITPRSRAIVPVHYAGVACEMDSINDIAKRHNLRVIEDAAQAVNATYKGAYCGTLGDFAAYSFHETKNFVCGEGGAFVARSHEFSERAEIVREKGTNRSGFHRGEVDKYTWIDMGSSFLPADILAAFLYAQLQRMDEITAARKAVYDRYSEFLEPLADRGLLQLPSIPNSCGSNFHMYFIMAADLLERSRLIDHLKSRGILAPFHYVPLHSSPMGMSMGWKHGMLHVTESSSERVVRLPMFFGLTMQEQMEVVHAIYEFFSIRMNR
jgi:dTDP-4-amino-4,6-dideoxygalactose transaminase